MVLILELFFDECMLQRSLSLRILLVNFLLLILPLLLYFFLVFRWDYRGEIVKAAYALQGLAENKATLLSQIVASGYQSLEVMDHLMELSSKKSELQIASTHQQLVTFAKSLKSYRINYFSGVPTGLNEQFIVRSSSIPSEIGRNYTSKEFLREAVSGVVSAYLIYSADSKNHDLLVSRAIYSENHTLMGVLSMALPAQTIVGKLVSSEYAPFDARLSLLTGDGIVFSSSDPALDLNAIYPISDKRLKKIYADGQFEASSIKLHTLKLTPIVGVEGAEEWTDNGAVRLGVRALVPGTTFSIFVDCDEGKVIKNFYKHLWQLVILISLATLVMCLVNLWLTRRISIPLKQLFDVMRQIASGDYQKRFQKDPFGYEINSIGAMLNEVVANLAKNMEVAKNARMQRELLAKELKIGRDIQMSILPQNMPKVDGVDVVAASLPALEVGGDFYDAYVTKNPVDLKEERLMLTIADGAGKGISACLYSLSLRSILRSYATEYLDVEKLMQFANNLFCLDTEKSTMFVTALIVAFESKTRKFSYYSAGHNPCIIRKKDGTLLKLSSNGMAMGVSNIDATMQKRSLELSSGDLIVLYTDGVTDAQTSKGELYGEARFLSFLSKYGEHSVHELIEEIFRDIEMFSAGAKQYDDITIVIMRVL